MTDKPEPKREEATMNRIDTILKNIPGKERENDPTDEVLAQLDAGEYARDIFVAIELAKRGVVIIPGELADIPTSMVTHLKLGQGKVYLACLTRHGPLEIEISHGRPMGWRAPKGGN